MSRSSAFRFEVLDKSFAADMHRVNRRCPIEAGFTFYFARTPDFFAWPDARFDTYRYMGMFRGEELVAYGMVGVLTGDIGGTSRRYLYGGDWRVVPEARGNNLVRRAGDALLATFGDEAEIGFGVVKRGNRPAERIANAPGSQRWLGRYLTTIRAVNLLMLWRPRPPKHCRVRQALPGDLEQMASLMTRQWRGRLFAPAVTAATLSREIDRCPGLRLEDYYVAEKAGRLMGVLAVWDMDSIKRPVVVGYSRRGTIIRRGYQLAGIGLRHLPPLPPPGGAFRTLTAHNVAVQDDEPAILRDLLRAAWRERAGQGAHMFHLAFVGDDPLAAAVRFWPGETFLNDIHLAYQPRAASRLKVDTMGEKTPPWINLANI